MENNSLYMVWGDESNEIISEGSFVVKVPSTINNRSRLVKIDYHGMQKDVTLYPSKLEAQIVCEIYTDATGRKFNPVKYESK